MEVLKSRTDVCLYSPEFIIFFKFGLKLVSGVLLLKPVTMMHLTACRSDIQV